MPGTIPGSPHQKKDNPGEELVAERKEDNLEFYESISREFAGGEKQEGEDEERMMIEYLETINDSLNEIATDCEKASQSFGRVEKTINSFVPMIERMYRKPAADATAAGSGGGSPPLTSVNNSRAEQRDSPKGFWSEEVEGDGIWNEVGGGEMEGAANRKDFLAEEHYRSVREPAPSPEPRPWQFQPGLIFLMSFHRGDFTNDKRPKQGRRFCPRTK